MQRSLSLVVFFLAGALAAQPQPPDPPCCWPPLPAPKLAVDWWTFDEPAGTTSADFAGAANNIGNDSGVVPRVPGKVGRAVKLQGSQWIQVANHNEVNFGGSCSSNDAEPGTIAFWIRAAPGGGVRTILDKREAGPGSLRGYSVYLWNNRIGFQMATGPGNLLCNSSNGACSNYIATTLPPVADNNWHFVAISFSRCNSPAGLFYVDGQVAPFAPRVGDLLNNSPLFIGRRAPALGPNFFAGELDEMMFFKFAYTKTDLDALRADRCNLKCRM